MKEKIKIFAGVLVFGLLVFWVSVLVAQSVVSQPVVSSASIAVNNPKINVSVVEFGDFQCPACGVAAPVFEQVRAEYSDRVDFNFLHFPLPMHQNAVIAAEASEAARAQGKFWEMYKKLYENQNDWSKSSNPIDQFVVYAKQLNLDVAKFKIDIQSGKYINVIQQDFDQGKQLGVNATPTFFINDKKIVGALSYSEFKNEIDAALKQVK